MTMNQVAKRAGVSQATVSRVVNGGERVSAEVVKAVKQAMEELDYRPTTRRKTSQRAGCQAPLDGSMVVLLMVDDSMDIHPTLALAKMRGVEAAAAAEGLTVAIARTSSTEQVPAVLQRPNLLGVLLWGRTVSEELKRALRQTPVMWLSSHADAEGQVVLVGNEQAGHLAANYLLTRGVRYPAFIAMPGLHTQEQRRCNGFEYALHLAGMKAKAISGDCRQERQFDLLPRVEQLTTMDMLAAELAAVRPRCDGVFIPDDRITALIYPALLQQGIEPGRDIAVISCGNEATYLNCLRPRPATIDLAPETTGRLAVEQLLKISKHADAYERTAILVTPKLILGEVDGDYAQ